MRDDVEDDETLYDKPLVRVISSVTGKGKWVLIPGDAESVLFTDDIS